MVPKDDKETSSQAYNIKRMILDLLKIKSYLFFHGKSEKMIRHKHTSIIKSHDIFNVISVLMKT